MKKTSILSLCIAFTLFSLSAEAADTAELTVTGTIRPTACTPALGNQGVVHHGSIDASEIPANQATVLETKTISFTVNCSGDTLLAVRLIDNKPDSVVPGLAQNLNSLPDDRAYGLGTVGAKNIGVYVVHMDVNSFRGSQKGVQGDRPVWSITRSGTSWYNGSLLTNYVFSSNGQDNWKAFASAGGSTPESWSSITGNLVVSTALDHGANLPLTEEIELSGSATLEVMYL